METITNSNDLANSPNDISLTMDEPKALSNRSSTAAIRSLGALIVIIASIIFLFQGAGAEGMTNSTMRHIIFLGISALFGGLTWILGAVVKENKGARTTIALGVATIPVLFTQIAAMLYDRLGRPDEALMEGINSAFELVPVSQGTFLLLTGATLLITIPIALLGNRILARKHMGPLTLLFMLGNALLLIPLRTNLLVIGLILTTATVGFLTYVVRVYKRESAMRTREGLIALVNLFVPIIILAARTLFLYKAGQTPFFIGTIMGLTGLVATILPMSFAKSKVGTTTQTFGAIFVALGWIVAFFGINVHAIHLINVEFYMRFLPVGLILFGLSFIFNNTHAVTMRRVALVLFAKILIIGQLISLGSTPMITTAAFITLLGTLALITIAIKMKEKSAIILSTVTLSASLMGLMGVTISTLSVSYSWVLLMIAGILVIVAGSLTEVFNKQWKGHLIQMKDEITSWQ